MPEYINCELCGANDYLILQTIKDAIKLVKCKSCDLIYVNPRPVCDQRNLYNQDYFKEWAFSGIERRDRAYKKRLKIIEKYKNPGRILDVGCGLGNFLPIARKRGWEVYGIEISSWAAQFIKEKLGFEVFNGQLYEADFPSRFFDVVVMWHSLEHISEPAKVLQEARRILKDEGLLVIAVPNVDYFVYKFFYRLFRGREKLLVSNKGKIVHLYYFSIKTLERLLEKCGFEALEAKPGTFGGFFREKMIEKIAFLIYFVTGKIGTLAFNMYAGKAERGE